VKPRGIQLHGVLALGSNLGDREATLRAAAADLDASEGIRVTVASGLIETPALKPAGVDRDAPAYLNAVLLIETTLSPRALLERVNAIEADHGRVRIEHWGDRTLDIDIIALGGLRIDEPDLVVPHPRAWERAFVLAPWAEVQPDAVIPERGRVADLLTATGETPVSFVAEALV
jgi:2-amino-4-hydroxy-6-hydroxymethyldihydropteridine diphosphokinase